MSVIYGIVMLNNQPVSQQVMDNMRSALEFTNPNTEALWKDENVAIGSLTHFITPESFKEKQPIFFEDNHKIMVFSGRIDNRNDLCRIFNISLIYRDNFPDSHYARLAFEKWGEECCDHLLGDWSFAVYDKMNKKLIVARDHCGIMACYYYSCADFFAFSSSPKALLALKEIPKEVNEFRIAQILVAWPGDGEQTCYQNIFNLLPGHYLTVENKTVQKHKYWELTEQPDLILPKEQDYYDQFLEIFTEAVRCRLRTTKQVGISLSGGLDSTSIAAIAAIELAKQNKELFAFTSVPLYKDYKVPKGRNGDEGELAGLMAKMYPNLIWMAVDAKEYSPIETIRKAVEIFDSPIHAAANQFWIQAINDIAIKHNCDILLNGQGGNGVISYPTAKVKGRGIKGIPYYKKQIKFQVNYCKDLILHPTTFHYPFLKYSDIKKEFAKRLNLPRKMKESGHDPRFNKTLSFKQTQINLIKQTFTNTYPLHFRKNSWYGISSLDPSSDIKFFEFSCSLPEKLYKNHNYQRILVEKGMKGILPEEILSSKKRGLQASDFFQRFNAIPNEIKTSLLEEVSHTTIFNNINLAGTSSCNRFARSLSAFYFLENF